jgi:hypothetical protein
MGAAVLGANEGLGSQGGTARCLPRVPLHAVLIQCAAKVAFFKLKLDQLIDSLCRVCLAESKQNLQRQKASHQRTPSLEPTNLTALLLPESHWRASVRGICAWKRRGILS